MFAERMWASWEDLGLVAVTATVMLAAVILAIRLSGLRALSKMSTFDFAVTLAIGSLLASTVATSTPFATGALAVFALVGLQALIARLRTRFGFGAVVDNRPLLLMRDGRTIESAMSEARVTESDLMAKLRQANVMRVDEVRAVVLETTGDISVLHGDGALDDRLLDGVRQPRPSERA